MGLAIVYSARHLNDSAPMFDTTTQRQGASHVIAAYPFWGYSMLDFKQPPRLVRLG